MQLIAHGGGCASGIEERRETQQRVLHALHLCPQNRNGHRADQQEMRDAHAAREQHDGHEQRVEHGDREIRLGGRENAQREQHNQERQQSAGEPLEQIPFLAHEHRRPHDDRELSDL